MHPLDLYSKHGFHVTPDELHFTLDFYFVYEFHLTLLGSLRELTAQAPLGPLLRVRVPLHADELPSLRGAHGAGYKAASQTSTSSTSPTSRSGRFTSISEELHGARRPKSTRSLHRCLLARSSRTVFVEA